MKRIVTILCALCLALTGCGMHTTELSAARSDAPTEETAVPQTDAPLPAADFQTFTDSFGTEFRLDMQKYSANLRVYTHDDIWISYLHCGYLSGMNRNSRWVIRSQAELDAFNEMYGLELELPEGYPNHGDDVEKPYDFAHDAMLIEYREVNSGGYDLRPGGVLIDGDMVAFVTDAGSQTPPKDEPVCEMMDGFLWLAALPQEVLPDPGTEWTYINADAYAAEKVTEPASASAETDGIGDCYMKPAADAEILTDAATGIRYVKNQLLVSCELDTDREQAEQLAKDVGAEIIGYIALTSDYQFEWAEDKTTDELQAIADRMNGYPFVLNVTLNMVHDISMDD